MYKHIGKVRNSQDIAKSGDVDVYISPNTGCFHATIHLNLNYFSSDG